MPEMMKPFDYKSYILRPRFRQATCAEVDCKHWREGWTIPLDALLADPAALAIAKHPRFRYTERVHEGKTYLVYSPGQPCFGSRKHRISIDERPGMWVGRGDRRTYNGQGLPPSARQHTRIDDWVDDFATHQQRLADEYNKG